MNYEQAEAYLLDLELFGMRFGLDRMHKLMTVLGMPQRRFASVHVVGSNGKSSTARMIAAILERHGVRTGTYTSPHLRSFAERIEVGERPIADADFAAAVTRIAHAAEMVNRTAAPDDRVTQFEALTAAAFDELARRRVEVAVVEAGLGGRWDATNVIPSKVQVLTSVGLEHTRWLGPTVADIAAEKLDVVRHHATLVVGPVPDEAEPVVERVVAHRHARLVRAPLEGPAPARALGRFQQQNFAVARSAAEAFLGSLDSSAVAAAAAEVQVPGRLELVSSDGPLVFHDGAHNPAGAAALAEALPDVVAGRRLVAVMGVLDDKDAAAMLRAILPLTDAAVFTRSSNPRSLPPATLEALAAQLGGPPAECVADPRAAVERARELAGPEGAVIATGSIYLIADLVRERRAARVSTL
ncbi:MAG: dihydrofolate synthase / folylpolyglutamate synthase [Thermoleophilaceae bacterium]|nr:dihydrofolate synthase / folylpolyglutamate synthase [Thermoleophilaceae bacterium]